MSRRAVLFFAITVAAVGADPTDAVREAAEGWMQAAVKQDQTALERFLAGDLSYSHANGRTQTKEEYIAAVMKGPPRYESFTLSDLKIRLYGKTAVLTAFCDVKMVGQENFRVRTLQVYLDNGGMWQMTAHQSARVGR
jgi:hypothetical protein